MLISSNFPPVMGYSVPNFFSQSSPSCILVHKILSTTYNPICNSSVFQNYKCRNLNSHELLVFSSINECGVSGNVIKEIETPRLKFDKKLAHLTEEQMVAISQFPSKMTNRCRALMRKIVCFSTEDGNVDNLLAAWVKSTKPRRSDWLSILKELERMRHPLYFEVFENAFTHESFEPNIRDYTKIIHAYAKQNMLQKAEKALSSMKNRGFVCDQVILTALIHMYSKAGNLELSEQSFDGMKLLGVPLDRRSYGSMIMAYIRAGKLDSGEGLIREMEARDVYAGREVYKALLRAYSMSGDSSGSQRVFDAIQLSGVVPDARLCGLLINAYLVSGQNREARLAFENMRKSGLVPNDRCVGLMLAACEKENRLNEALNLLIDLEREGFVLGKESRSMILNWFQKLGIEEQAEVVFKDLVHSAEIVV